MKRCPECGRDYNDDSMSFCLDDGTNLLFGPATIDEPATAILPQFSNSADPAIRSAEYPERATAIMQPHVTEDASIATTDPAIRRGVPIRNIVMIAIAAAALVAVGSLGYRYFIAESHIESIAVLPFITDNGNEDIEYLSDGMTETLIKSLAELPRLNVKPRSSVFRYKGKDMDVRTIGRELNVQAVLNGRVIQRGEQLSLSLELIDLMNDKVLWTEQYQRKRSDIVVLQSEIAKDISTKLLAKLSGAEEARVTVPATIDPEAYQAFLKGRYYWNRRTKENVLKAIEQFKIATDRDPKYALAYVGLADCYAVIGEYAGTPTLDAMPKAREFAERAIMLDDRLAEPHATLGIIYKFSWDWERSEAEFKRAIQKNPNYPTAYHWYSIMLRSLGRFRDTADAMREAERLDPLSSIIGVNVSDGYQMLEEHERSIETMLKVIELDPNFSAAYENLGASQIELGRNEDGLQNLEKAVELSKRSAVRLRGLGYGYAVSGRRAEALAIAKELEEKFARNESNGQYIASVYSGLGDLDNAFKWLEKDFGNRHGSLPDIVWRIHFKHLRGDARYTDLLSRMNIKL